MVAQVNLKTFHTQTQQVTMTQVQLIFKALVLIFQLAEALSIVLEIHMAMLVLQIFLSTFLLVLAQFFQT